MFYFELDLVFLYVFIQQFKIVSIFYLYTYLFQSKLSLLRETDIDPWCCFSLFDKNPTCTTTNDLNIKNYTAANHSDDS